MADDERKTMVSFRASPLLLSRIAQVGAIRDLNLTDTIRHVLERGLDAIEHE